MASKISTKTTFEPAKIIEPIYTGGDVSLDSSGQFLATCVEEDVLIVELETGEPLGRIESDGEPVTSLCLSPSASHLVVCSRSLSMRIFALSLSENPHTITTQLQRTLKPHNSPVVTSAIDETGTLLATGGADGTVKVWDVQGGYVTHTFHGSGGVVSALCFFQKNSPGLGRKGKRKSMNDDYETILGAGPALCLASGSEDGSIRIWDLNKRKSTAVLDSHVSVVRSLDYSSERQTLLSASRDKTIILWDSETWKTQKVIPVLEVIESAGFISGGDYCYSGGEHGVVRIWNSATGNEVTEEQAAGAETDAIVAMECPSKSIFLLSVHQDQTLRAHSLQRIQNLPVPSRIESLPIMKRLSGNHDEIIDLACVGPQRSLLALATNTESIRLITIDSYAEFGSDASSKSSKNRPDQQQFGGDVALLEGHSDIIICIDVDWSGHWLATGAKDNSARLWRLDPSTSSFICFATFVGHAESLGAIALPRSPPPPKSPANIEPLSHPPQYLLTGSQDRTIKRWETSKFKVDSSMREPHNGAKALYTRVAHEKDINAIDVSATSPLFASASQDRTIKIWSLEDGSVAGILRGHKRGVWSIRFAPADTPPIKLNEGGTSSSRGLLVSGSGDRTVKVWSLSTYTCLLTFEGHSNSVLKVIWLSPLAPNPSNNGDEPASSSIRGSNKFHANPIIASASSDTLIKLWSPYTLADSSDHLLATLDNHTDRVWALASHSNSAFPLISGAADATITFWKDTSSQTASEATKRASERIEQDQELQNHILARNYREVITLALQLNHPGRLLKLFEDVILSSDDRDDDNNNDTREKDTADTPGNRSITGSFAVDQVLSSLSHEQLLLLLQRIRDWNTNARNAPIAQRVLHCLLKAYPISTFIDMASATTKGTTPKSLNIGRGAVAGVAAGGVKDLLRALEVYTERHYKRMEELMDESYLLEYTLREMDEVGLGVGGVGGLVALDGNRSDDVDVDIDADTIDGGGDVLMF